MSIWGHRVSAKMIAIAVVVLLLGAFAVAGAGIAGIATAFFTLKYTDKNVTLLERYKLAHGATGHNAGQVTSYFESGFASMAEEFGLDMAKFTKVFDAPETQAAVDRDLADGGRAGVNATPTIYINGKKYQGAIALEQLTPIITAELKGK